MSIYDTLNKEQKEAVFYTDGPLLILAGAGSGKTRVLTHRVAYLIEQKGVNPWNILAITFTNKAAGEMRERVDKLVEFGSEGVWVSTFHSMCVRILRRYIDQIGYKNNFTIYDSDDQKTAIKEVCKKLNIDTKKVKERTFMGAISSAKNELISPERYEMDNKSDFSKSDYIKVYWEYQDYLKKNNALDFDDLILKTVELFKKCPDVLDSYQERFKYIMVDEYQDTNTAQFILVSLIAKKYKNLCVVGDDDQSIYKFRGANISNILDFEKTFSNAKVIKLEQNYRSTGNILNAANGVIQHNIGRKGKTLWTDKGPGEKIEVVELENEYREGELVAGTIRKLVNEEGCSYKDFACLYRTNAQSRVLEEKLMMSNIPYKIVGGVNFYQRKEIKDVLAYLKTIDNGADDVAVKRIINVPRRGIGATSIEKIQAYAYEHEMNFYDAIKTDAVTSLLGRAASKVLPFIALIESIRSQNDFTVEQIINAVLESTGYIEALKAEGTDEANDRIANIEELINKAVNYNDTNENPTLSGFLEEIALVADIDNLDESQEYVVLMTIHSAKGLEFPRVFLCGMEDGLFPSIASTFEDAELEEERRLCYVAITRAMQELTITWARERMTYGQNQRNNISRFIREIPPLYIEMIGNTSRKNNYSRGESAHVDLSSRGYGNSGYYEGSTSQHLFGSSYTTTARNAAMKKPAFGKAFVVEKADSQSGLGYEVGDKVKHIKFGTGIVMNIADGGRDFEVTVDFEKAGMKKMFASFAKLKKL
ncbi:MAG: DNA helicase PcrA [Eubacterium sp.]